MVALIPQPTMTHKRAVVQAPQPPRMKDAAQDDAVSTQLPSEICHDIVANIADMVQLKRCSLVCRAWVPSCRVAIFKRVVIDSSAKSNMLYSILTQSPHIANYIREVELCGLDWIRNDVFLPYLFLKLRGQPLKHLHFRRLSWADLPRNVLDIVHQQLPTLLSLEFTVCTFQKYTDLTALLRRCERLNALQINSTNAIDDVGVPLVAGGDILEQGLSVSSAVKLSPLERLEIGKAPSLRAVSWMLHPQFHFDTSKLHTLIIPALTSSEDANVVSQLLEASGGSLMNLDVAAWNYFKEFDYVPDLSASTSLAHITIRSLELNTIKSVQWVTSFLAQPSLRQSIQTLELEVNITMPRAGIRPPVSPAVACAGKAPINDWSRWEALWSVLGPNKVKVAFPKLTEVKIALKCRSTRLCGVKRDEEAKAIEKLLPRVVNGARLEVVKVCS